MKKIISVNIHFDDNSGIVIKNKEHLKAIRTVLEKYKLWK